MFGTKPSFGTTTPGFGGTGFGSTPTSTTPFGQSTFGNKPSAFGSPSFGSTTPSLFGAPNTTASGMFGSNTSTGFGGFGTTTTSGGGGLFGSQPTQTQTGGLFGSGGSAFGTQNKPGFGFSSTTSTSGGGLFGQQQQQTSLFGQPQTSTGAGGLFGSGGFGGAQAMTGTTVKFNPVTASDTMVKNGQTQHINTRHQCVTCMKEYETKSLEELRLEDYVAGRKSGGGGQIGGTSMGFGGTSQPSTGIFGTSTTTSGGLFGAQTQNKPLFGGGTTTSAFGSTTGGGLFGQQQNQSSGLFNNKPIGFGAPTTSTTTGFGFNNNTGGALFGATNQNKSLFGTSTGTFNQTSQPSAFGSSFGSSPFGTQNQQTNSLFGQQNKPFGSSFTSPTNTFGGFGTPSTSSGGGLFGNTAANKPAFSFGNTANPTGFPTNTSSTGSLFAQKPGNFNFPTSNAFSTPSFGNTGTSLFGNTQNKPGGVGTGFGNTSFNFGSSLGGTNNTGFGFGSGTFGGFNSQQQQQQQHVSGIVNQLQQQILAMATNPYGDSPLFKSMLKETGKRQEMLKLTNTPKGKSLSAAKVASVMPLPRPKPAYSTTTNQSLFDGLEEDTDTLSPRVFLPKPGYKKLLINPKKEESKKNLENGEMTPSKDNNDIQLVTSDITSDLDDRSPATILIPKVVLQDISNGFREMDSLDDSIVNLNVKKKPEKTPPAKRQEGWIFLLFEDPPEENEENLEPHPTGIVLRRSGYYTIPSLDTLATMMDKEGKIMLEGFTIGRKGYGCVFFPDRMDVANLDLDDIVHIRRREITVYPDDDKRPPVGQGLNRPAEVTLDDIWPRDKSTKEDITDPDRLADFNFAAKLERATSKKGAMFKEYRSETGSWVFVVKHF